MAYANKGDWDKAIADCSEAIRLNPKLAVVYGYRGFAYDSKGDYDNAIADYTEAIRLDSKLAVAYYSRGNAYSTAALTTLVLTMRASTAAVKQTAGPVPRAELARCIMARSC